MNLILFDVAEIARPLSRRDPRARHILEILRQRVGDTFDAGIIDGPRGKGTLAAMDANGVKVTFEWGPEPPPLVPITLVIGLPRPQTARKILQEATSLGVAAMHFIVTEKGEANYAQSRLWLSGEWRRHLIAGAEQAFCTRLPKVTHGRSLPEIMSMLPEAANRLALDNYEAPIILGQVPDTTGSVVVAIGPERGWSPTERELLRNCGFAFAHLGTRVLRTETACTAAIAVTKCKMGLM